MIRGFFLSSQCTIFGILYVESSHRNENIRERLERAVNGSFIPGLSARTAISTSCWSENLISHKGLLVLEILIQFVRA